MSLHVGPVASREFPRALFSIVLALCVLVAVASVAVLTACSHSPSSSLSRPPFTTPTVVPGTVIACPSGFFSGTPAAVCQSATVAGCPNASDLNFTYSYDNPGSPKGTIVLLSGGGGNTAPGNSDFAGFYFGQGYEVVQIEWSSDWEFTTIPPDTTTHAPNIRVAACRQAAFLNFVFNTNNTSLYSSGGRCAQGASAGSGAIAYSLTYYGAQNYLDAVEFESGPPLADIKQGCEEPMAPDVQVCGAGTPTASHCQLGGTSSWQLSPVYTQQADGVRNATNDNSCAVSGQATSAASNQAWLNQSIVDDGTGNPTFNYPHTAMTAWLCQSVFNNSQCVGGFPGDGGQGGTPDDDCPNNSSSQAQIYFSNVTSNYTIYAVQNCDTSEGVNGLDATVAALGTDGTDAIEQDMLNQCRPH